MSDETIFDKDGRSPLFYAIDSGDIKQTTLLLELGLRAGFRAETSLYRYLTFFNEPQQTSLHFAAMRGNPAIVGLLIDYGWDKNHLDKQDFSPLYYAVKHGHLEAVKALVAKGCDIQGQQLLHWAIKYDRLDIFKFLLEAGVRVNEMDYCRVTPLYLAMTLEKNAFIDPLIEYQADFYYQPADQHTCTLLYLAALNADLTLLQKFIDNGADINRADANGNTPLRQAVKAGRIDVVKILFAHGADPKSIPPHLIKTKNFDKDLRAELLKLFAVQRCMEVVHQYEDEHRTISICIK